MKLHFGKDDVNKYKSEAGDRIDLSQELFDSMLASAAVAGAESANGAEFLIALREYQITAAAHTVAVERLKQLAKK